MVVHIQKKVIFVLYLYIYIAPLEEHTNPKRFQCKRSKIVTSRHAEYRESNADRQHRQTDIIDIYLARQTDRKIKLSLLSKKCTIYSTNVDIFIYQYPQFHEIIR